jgi:hypothetical protein
MSNRQAEAKTILQISHERQIEALLNGDIEAWLDAALLGPNNEGAAFRASIVTWHEIGESVAKAAWRSGAIPFSLFALLPECGCPVQERQKGNLKNERLIPSISPSIDWRPTREVLEAFARIQQAHRT